MPVEQPKSKCLRCGKRAPDVEFAKLAKNGRFDSHCIKCRFLVIDAKHSDIDGIRDDMREADLL